MAVLMVIGWLVLVLALCHGVHRASNEYGKGYEHHGKEYKNEQTRLFKEYNGCGCGSHDSSCGRNCYNGTEQVARRT